MGAIKYPINNYYIHIERKVSLEYFKSKFKFG